MQTNKGKTATIALSLLLISLVSLYFYLRQENKVAVQQLTAITDSVPHSDIDTLKKESKTTLDTTDTTSKDKKNKERVVMDIIDPVEPYDPYDPEPYDPTGMTEPVPDPPLEPNPPVDNSNNIFVIAEQMPEFIGGETALNTFIVKNMVYPEIAIEMGVEGTVFLGFVVNKDSSISDIKMLKSAHESLTNEAIRVLKLTDKMWKPGKQNGNLVRMEMRIPIKFRLN